MNVSGIHGLRHTAFRRLAVLAAVARLLTVAWNEANAAPNILLIIGRGMGLETLASHGLGEQAPATAP